MVLQVSYKFARLSDRDLDNFVDTFVGQMSGNAVYPNLPSDATLAMVSAANDDFHNKISQAAMGGEMDTTAKNLSRQALLKLCRKVAGYVQITASNLEELQSSGFEARSTNRAKAPLEKPTGVTLKNGDEGQLVARLAKPVKNSNFYEGRASIDGGTTWLSSIFSGDSRHIIFAGLTLGAVYTIEIRALGGSTNQSDFSDPVSHRVI